MIFYMDCLLIKGTINSFKKIEMFGIWAINLSDNIIITMKTTKKKAIVE